MRSIHVYGRRHWLVPLWRSASYKDDKLKAQQHLPKWQSRKDTKQVLRGGIMNSLSRVVLEAPAKINLFLEITARREDGYHLLDTVMQAVSLQDIVVAGRRREPGIRVTCSRPGIPEDESNLVHRAAALFLEATGADIGGVHIHIDKQIPPQAGLGGGSADAAAALVGLNALARTGLSPARLCELGLRLGADVPFMFGGGCAFAQGIGEKLRPLEPGLSPCTIVLAKPAAGVSTAAAYRAWDEGAAPAQRPVAPVLEALALSSLAETAAGLYNVFERICPSEHTARITARMREHGALSAALSGSGSAVFGLFTQPQAAARCAAALAKLVEEVFLCQPVGHGAKIIHSS